MPWHAMPATGRGVVEWNRHAACLHDTVTDRHKGQQWDLCIQLSAGCLHARWQHGDGTALKSCCSEDGKMDCVVLCKLSCTACFHVTALHVRGIAVAGRRTPGGQAKVMAEIKSYLTDAEDACKQKRLQRNDVLYNDKMRATQTASAFGLQCV